MILKRHFTLKYILSHWSDPSTDHFGHEVRPKIVQWKRTDWVWFCTISNIHVCHPPVALQSSPSLSASTVTLILPYIFFSAFFMVPSCGHHLPHLSPVACCSPQSPSPAPLAACRSYAHCWPCPSANNPGSCSGFSSLHSENNTFKWS